MKIRNHYYQIKKEALLCQLEVQQKSLQLFEKMVYENVGQVLSLAKMQLSSVDLQANNTGWLKVNYSRRLIGKAIKDLRETTRQPTTQDIIKNGFASATKDELGRIKLIKKFDADFITDGSVFKLPPNRELILFNIFQHLVYYILLRQVKKFTVSINYSNDGIAIKIIFANKTAKLYFNDLINGDLSLNRRTKLIGARLKIERLQEDEVLTLKIKK